MSVGARLRVDLGSNNNNKYIGQWKHFHRSSMPALLELIISVKRTSEREEWVVSAMHCGEFLSYSVKLISSSFERSQRICASSPTTKYVSLERTLTMMIMGQTVQAWCAIGINIIIIII